MRVVDFQNCGLSQVLVDQVLREILTSTVDPNWTGTVTVSLQGNTAPSSSGQADVTTLRNAGHTVNL